MLAFAILHNLVVLWAVEFVGGWISTIETTASFTTPEEPVQLEGPRQSSGLSVLQDFTCNDWGFVQDFTGSDLDFTGNDLDFLALVIVVTAIATVVELLSSKGRYCMYDGDDSSENNNIPTTAEEEEALKDTSETLILPTPKCVRFSELENDWNTADRVKMGRRKVKRRLLSPKVKTFKASTSVKRPKRKAATVALGRLKDNVIDEIIILSPSP